MPVGGPPPPPEPSPHQPPLTFGGTATNRRGALARSPQYRLDDVALRLGVVVHVAPLAAGQRALARLVRAAVGLRGAEAVAEPQVAADLGAADGPEVDVD